MTTTDTTDAPPELLPQIRRRFERALEAARNFKGMSAGSPKVTLEISDVDYLLKWLRALKWLGTRAPSAPAGQGDRVLWLFIQKLAREAIDNPSIAVRMRNLTTIEAQAELEAQQILTRRATPSPSPAPDKIYFEAKCASCKAETVVGEGRGDRALTIQSLLFEFLQKHRGHDLAFSFNRPDDGRP